ncbi:MAG: hypothetical protein ACI9WC_002289 [Arenicella sp.]
MSKSANVLQSWKRWGCANRLSLRQLGMGLG